MTQCLHECQQLCEQKHVTMSSALKPDDGHAAGARISNFSLDHSCLLSPLHSAIIDDQ